MPFILKDFQCPIYHEQTFYNVFLPNRCAHEGIPIVVYLHGKGERGTDPTWVLPPEQRECIEKLNPPAVILFPQCSVDYRAFYGSMEDRVLQVVDWAAREYGSSRDMRLIGYSMGASSCLYLGARHPERVVSIVSIAQGFTWPEADWPPNLPDSPEVRSLFHNMFIAEGRASFIAERISSIPIWFIHGSLDQSCPVEDSRSVADFLEQRGGNCRLTEFSDLGHDSLARGLQQTGLFEWLLAVPARN